MIVLRLYRLAQGGANACEQAYLMCAEKVAEANTASLNLLTGGRVYSVVTAYRSVVHANVSRLTT